MGSLSVVMGQYDEAKTFQDLGDKLDELDQQQGERAATTRSIWRFRRTCSDGVNTAWRSWAVGASGGMAEGRYREALWSRPRVVPGA